MSHSAQSGAPRKRCTVAYATPARQYLWQIELPLAATIADALTAARERSRVEAAACAAIPWETAEVGVFGERRSRGDTYAEGDRIELYRPLARDPRARRREKVRRERRTSRTGGR
ncbi:MAG: RnfH family protein [Gammaproteobacteria bacterium]|nr:RnfH family protein [Gammaproteobacteria bacterium]